MVRPEMALMYMPGAPISEGISKGVCVGIRANFFARIE